MRKSNLIFLALILTLLSGFAIAQVFGTEINEKYQTIETFAKEKLLQFDIDIVKDSIKQVNEINYLCQKGEKCPEKLLINSSIIYSVNDGTSMSSPMITGFLALMLSEFPDDKDFSRDQLLYVCYDSGLKLHDSSTWNQKSIF